MENTQGMHKLAGETSIADKEQTHGELINIENQIHNLLLSLQQYMGENSSEAVEFKNLQHMLGSSLKKVRSMMEEKEVALKHRCEHAERRGQFMLVGNGQPGVQRHLHDNQLETSKKRGFGEAFPESQAEDTATPTLVLPNKVVEAQKEDVFAFSKSLLHELAMKERFGPLNYITSKHGEPHCPVFVSTLKIGGKVFRGEAAKTKKDAEKKVSIIALEALKNSSSDSVSDQGGTMVSSTNTTGAPKSPTATSIASLVLPIKLEGNNYPIWRSKVFSVLCNHDLDGYVKGTKPCPPKFIKTDSEGGQSMNLDYVTWYQQDQALRSWLFASMTEDVLKQVVGCGTTSIEVWRILEQLYAAD